MDPNIAGSATQGQSRSVDSRKLKFKRRLRLEAELSGIPHKALAYGLATSDAQLSRYKGDQYPDSLHDYEIPDLTHELGPGFMEFLALQCGGVYTHGAAATSNQPPVAVLIGLLAKTSGDSVQQLVQALEDHDWSQEEKLASLPVLRKLYSIVGALLQDAEGGAR